MGRAAAFRSIEEEEALASPAPSIGPPMQYRVVVFGRPRGEWRDAYADAMQDAIDQKLTAWDASKRQHYLAVPTDIEVRRVPR